MADLSRVRRVLGRGLRLRCPRCGEASLFASGFRMRSRCPACALVFEREAGYWVGAIYVNYGLTVTVTLAGYFLLEAWLAPAVRWQLAIWIPFVVVFPIATFRLSKALWLSLDHLLDPGESRGRSSGP